MSIWTDIQKAVGKGVSQRITQAISPQSKALPAVVAGIGAAGSRVLPAIGRVLGSRTLAAASTGFVAGQLFDADGNPVPKRRRMNFGNARAARRAIRRIKGVRRLLKSIEDQLPRRPAPRRRAAAHHDHHHGHHGS